MVRPLIAASFGLVLAAPAAAQAIEGVWDAPTADRWNYGFNTTPGTRPVASVFGYTGDLYEFDERDGQVVLVFDTADQIAAGLGADRYRIDYLEVKVTLADPLAGGYDPTPDAWTSHLDPADPAFTPDRDPGRAIELFATGFRNDETAATWTESTDFSLVGAFGKGVRTAYAAEIGPDGTLNDVSNSISDGWTPTSLAVGRVNDAAGGDELAEGTVIKFSFEPTDPATETWLGEGLDQGRLVFSLSSLIEAQQQGGDFIDLYMRENPLVTVGVRSAATLRVEGWLAKPCDGPGDLDHDCAVGGGDIGIMLSVWGTDDAEADLDGNGLVDGADFGLLLTLFGS